MYEIVTYGGDPYPGLSNAEVIAKVTSGKVMEKPKGCPDDYYAIMVQCWAVEPNDRPTFKQLYERLKSLLKEDNLNNSDASNSDSSHSDSDTDERNPMHSAEYQITPNIKNQSGKAHYECSPSQV
jgi:hypothetical protein